MRRRDPPKDGKKAITNKRGNRKVRQSARSGQFKVVGSLCRKMRIFSACLLTWWRFGLVATSLGALTKLF